MEKTFMMLKPDGLRRGLLGNVLQRVELKGYRIVALKIAQMDQKAIDKHYEEHIGRVYYQRLSDYMLSGPVVQMVIEGNNVIDGIRKMNGATDSSKSEPGTIRGDLGQDTTINLIHGSDSLENAEREIDLYFTKDEIVSW